MPIETTTQPWKRLAGKIAPEVLEAPKTCGDFRNKGDWPEVEDKVVAYLENNVVGKLWADQLALAALVLTARRRQASTVLGMLWIVAPRFVDLFDALGYKSMQDWNPTEAFKMYLRAEVLPNHTDRMRSELWLRYSSATNQIRLWLNSLPAKEQAVYQNFALPVPDRSKLYETKKLSVQVKRHAKKNRKIATDAVVSSLPTIRAKSQLRLNRYTRVRQAYYDALKILQSGRPYTLPFSYFYDEGEDSVKGIPPQERYHFRIWDRRTFVLAHQDRYSASSIKAVWSKTGAYSDENNCFFLEFVRAERLMDDGSPEGLWFEDLLRRKLIGLGPRSGTEEEVRAKQEYLRSWGYGDEDKADLKIQPFLSGVAGLLNWPKAEAAFMKDAQSLAEGVLIPVEPLYAAAMFGLLALGVCLSNMNII